MSDLNEGQGAFLVCIAVWIVTTYVGLRVTIPKILRRWRRRQERRKKKRVQQDPEQGLQRIPTFKMARTLGDEEAPIAIQVKERSATLLGRFRKADKQVVRKENYAPIKDSVDARLFRLLDLCCAEALTVIEAFIKICRDIGDAHNSAASERIRLLEPFVEKQEEVAAATDVAVAEMLRGNDAGSLIDAALALAQEQVARWTVLVNDYSYLGLREPTDGRFNVGWDRRSASRKALEDVVASHMSFVNMRQAALLPPLSEMTPVTSWRFCRLFPPQVRRHPVFYTLVAAVYIAVFAPFAAGVGKNSWGGLWGTFLAIPPQYCIDCFEDGSGVTIQRILVPLIYGVMHTAMLSLGLMPIPLCKGLLRDFTNAARSSRGCFPIEDSVWLHKVFGALMIGALFIGATLWLIAMGSTCTGFATDDQTAIDLACTAFAPVIFDAKAGPIPQVNNVSTFIMMPDLLFDSIKGASFFDPRDNVLFLRIVAWACFFGVTPWIAFRDKTTFSRFVPHWVARNWFEIVTYSHIFVAWAAVIMALYARFEVFFGVLLPWTLLIVDKVRERLFHTISTPIYYGKGKSEKNYIKIHVSGEEDGRPTAVQVVVDCPNNFKYSAGQYVFLTVPELGPTPHAFSLASCPNDESIHLHIGVRSGCEFGTPDENWKPGAVWDQVNPTFTFSLVKAIQKRLTAGETRPIKAFIRGPYGSPFQQAYAKNFATVLVGQGTGLTSALSVLKDVISRRVGKNPSCERVWFVWSCKTIRDLRWCWKTLQQTILKAYKEHKITLPDDWSAATSSTLDWLGISLFVSRAEKTQLLKFLGYGELEEVDYEPIGPMRTRDRLNEMELGIGNLPPAIEEQETDEDENEVFQLQNTAPPIPPRAPRRRCPGRQVVDDLHLEASAKDRFHAKEAAGAMSYHAQDTEPFASQPILARALSRRRRFSSAGAGTGDEAIYVSSHDHVELDAKALELLKKVHTASAANRRRAFEELNAYLNGQSDLNREAEISAWLKNQVIPARFTRKGADIRDLLQSLKQLGPPNARIVVVVCSGQDFAQSLESLCCQMNVDFEYLAHAN